MAACEEHQEVVDLTLRVGNVYRTDGTIVPAQHHKAQGDDAPMAVGVLVAVGGQDDNYSALVMALEDEFGVEIPDDQQEKLRTVQNAIDFIVANGN